LAAPEERLGEIASLGDACGDRGRRERGRVALQHPEQRPLVVDDR